MPYHYPPTRRDESVVDDYHGVKIADPYRWLEDDNAPETEAWVAAQNQVTEQFLAGISFRETMRARLNAAWNYPRNSLPNRVGEYFIWTHNTGLQKQAVYYIRKGLEGEPRIFLDPNTLSEDGTVSTSIVSYSPDHTYAVLATNASGSDWHELTVRRLPDGEELPDRLRWIKFSGAAWDGDGFYYTRYPEPEKGAELTQESLSPMICYHRLGDDQANDRVIFTDPEHPRRYLDIAREDNGEHLFLTLSSGTSGSEIRFRRVDRPGDPFQVLFPGFDYDTNLITEFNGHAYFLTNDHATNFRLVRIDMAHPERESWTDLIPESGNLLDQVSIVGDRILAVHLVDVTARMSVYDLDGSFLHEVALPGPGAVNGMTGQHDDPGAFYMFSSYNTPANQYYYDCASGETRLFLRNEYSGNLDDIVVRQEFAVSKDGTRVPMFLVHHRDLAKSGDVPVLLYGYGGFSVCELPAFSVAACFFAAQGGIMAVANLRGGNEYGEEWHRAGMLGNKQNVFDDFIACAEHLIAAGYTNPGRIAIKGGSNGGLLVGACVNQRPGLFRAALAQVGVMDMLRYHKFTVGWGWVVEYGSADDPAMFPVLNAYSPYHNLKPGTHYPAVLVTTADHDDRVVPAHSFKYAARLQECQAGDQPVMIRIDVKSGHGGSNLHKTIDLITDTLAFVMDRLGMEYRD